MLNDVYVYQLMININMMIQIDNVDYDIYQIYV